MSEYKIQDLADPWWVKDEGNDYRRGRLIKTFIPHVEQIPSTLDVVGRKEASNHSLIDYKIYPLSIKKLPSKPNLPVAALPLFKNEVNLVLRAKVRPAIILDSGGKEVEKKLRRNKPNKNTSPTLLIAPCYGARPEGRAGYGEELIKRMYQCEYPQFMVDTLPLDSNIESVIRFDHLQPVGKHHESIELTDFSLGEEALKIMDEWLDWLLTGILDEDSVINDFQQGVEKLNEI